MGPLRERREIVREGNAGTNLCSSEVTQFQEEGGKENIIKSNSIAATAAPRDFRVFCKFTKDLLFLCLHDVMSPHKLGTSSSHRAGDGWVPDGCFGRRGQFQSFGLQGLPLTF